MHSAVNRASLELRRRLEREVLLCDGAMGTMLDAAGVSMERCRPELSLSRPDLVRAIHRAYVSAGADVVETNTFMANRVALGRFGLEGQVERINSTSVALAREVCTERGRGVLVAGSVGPAVSPRHTRLVGESEAVEALVEQVAALERAGVDLLVFETFGDLGTLVSLIDAASEVSSLPIVAQATFLEDGRTITGDAPQTVAVALDALGVAAIGVNCALGPRATRKIVEELAAATMTPLSVQPNAGPPTLVNGRFRYPENEEYFARAAREFVELGASIVGGCCGTTPRHTEAISKAVRGLPPRRRSADTPHLKAATHQLAAALPDSGRFRGKLKRGEFVVGCELRLPDGSDPDQAIASASKVRAAGADVIVIAPTPSARVHMSPMTFGLLLRERLGMDCVLSTTTFNKSALGLQADLLGAHSFGLQTVLCRTGTAPPQGEYPSLSGIFELTSIDLIAMLSALNEARDQTGAHISRATSFLIGARVKPAAVDVAAEVARTRQKVAAGAHFLVTESVFDIADLRRFLDALGDPGVPVLLGVTALRDFEHAEYLLYETQGVQVPDSVLARLSGAAGPSVGLEIVSELVWEASGLVQGVIASPASGGAAEGAELVGAILGLQESLPPPLAGHGDPERWEQPGTS